MSRAAQRSGPTEDDNELPTRAAREARPGIVLLFSGAVAGSVTRVWPLTGSVALGRGDSTGVLPAEDDRASREHAAVSRVGASFVVRDLGSRNGTFVGGRRLSASEPATGERLLVRIGQSLLLLAPDVNELLSRDPAVSIDDGFVVGPAVRRLLGHVARTAAVGDPLLVEGQSGSGKELIARRYHHASPRASGPFVAVNSAAIPEAIAERLFFGAVRGAYSGAAGDAPGYLQEAHGGTLFLDELGELPLPVQAKLLRVLETGEVTPVGGTRPRPASFGLVAATNRDLRAEIADGRFRADFYYRVGRVRLALPPLRQRVEEIPWLVAEELRALGPLAPSVRLVEACCLAAWPGNLRELRSEVRAAGLAALADGVDLVTLEHLSATAGQSCGAPAASGAIETARSGTSREVIEAALAAAKGNVTAAARSLHMHRNQLYRLMERHGIGRSATPRS